MPSRPASRCPQCRTEFTDRAGRPCRGCRTTTDRQIKRRSEWRWVYRDPRWARLRDQVLSEQPLCACGCGSGSTVVDHIRDHRGDPDLAFDRANCQGMAKVCHDRKTAGEHLADTGQLAPVIVVAGPPCSGKTTYVQAHATPGDLVVDYDQLAAALGSPDTHDHPEALHPFALEAREAVLARLRRPNHLRRAWLVTTSHTPEQLVEAAEVIELEVEQAEAHRRARAAGRPQLWHELIDDWFTIRRAREQTAHHA